ncbi:MAG: helix-turn-helix domain-containing protein [Candidatus Gastranaerophilales bacterium]|nr:helix-turn-helix domain-containing protein [Candidatus Gastranaerophilales bacterium]
MNKVLNIEQAAEKLNLKKSTLYAWVHKKKITHVKIGGKLGFLEKNLDDFIESNIINKF